MRFSAPPKKRLAFSVKRLVFSFLLVTSCYLLVAISPTFAQVPQSTQNANTTNSYNTPSTNPDVPKNLHTYTQSVMIETMSALVCQLAGVDPVNPNQKCLGVDQQTGKIGFVKNGGGLVTVMGNMISMLYTPPIHTKDYFQNLAGNFGFVKQANAQSVASCNQALRGFGFCAISPLLPIWSAFRNIVYLLFVLIFITVGFAIMLRIRIDPRTVMTIQNQIPKIIVGLILVTFSFAIAGFLIDIMYLSIYLIGNTLISTDSHITTTVVNQIATSKHPFEAANNLSGASGGVGGILNIAWWSALDVGKIINGLLSNILGQPLSFIFGSVLGIIGFLIIIIAIIIALFKLWFALISAYIFLLLDIVMAPFWIFAGLIPGSPIGFGLWLRDILSNLSAFPVVITMFIMARVFMDIFAQPGQGVFSPPLVGSLNSDAFAYLIGLGFILLTPNVVAMTKAALKAPKFDTTPIKQAIGGGTAVTTGTTRSIASSWRTLVAPSAQKRLSETGRPALVSKLFDKL